jgi:hypothetical protein
MTGSVLVVTAAMMPLPDVTLLQQIVAFSVADTEPVVAAAAAAAEHWMDVVAHLVELMPDPFPTGPEVSNHFAVAADVVAAAVVVVGVWQAVVA